MTREPPLPPDRSPAAADPLSVLTSTASVVERAVHVRIEDRAVERLADRLATDQSPPPAGDATLHFGDGTWRTAGWVFVLDALNFCFWGQVPDPTDRWRVGYRGEVHDGYAALAAALTRAVEEGHPLWDAGYLAEITEDDLAEILRPHDGSPAIPLFDQRLANLRELGHGFRRYPTRDGEQPVEAIIRDAGRSAVHLIEAVVGRFSSFDDVAHYPAQTTAYRLPPTAREVRFYKRAQILVADLYGAFAGEGLGAFDDLDVLTAFADYKVPQVLRRFGVLVYDDRLAARVDRRQLLPSGSREEIEIRAAMVWACELIRRALVSRGRAIRAFEIDWLLWTAGQSLPPDTRPYHRTVTVFY